MDDSLTQRRRVKEEGLRVVNFFYLNSRKRDLSNPIRDPRFRVSASGAAQSLAFAFGVPLDINAFHRYT